MGIMRATKKYKRLPYNPYLKRFSKKLRKAGMLHEALMWNKLKSKKLNGLDFDRQKIIDNYIVDFYCAEKSVVIEIDGSSHYTKKEADAQRDAHLRSLGLEVIRITVSDVFHNMKQVISFLKYHPLLQ